MKNEISIVSDLSCWATAFIVFLGLIYLAVSLKEVQVEDAAMYNLAFEKQANRRVETAGLRGKILDRNGFELAVNRKSRSIIIKTEYFQKNSWDATIDAIEEELKRVGECIGSKSTLERRAIERHIKQALAMPLVAWRDVSDKELAKFCEHEEEFPGFGCEEGEERFYPYGTLASHLIGYVGRGQGDAEAGDRRFDHHEQDMCGKSGLEVYYNSWLIGVSGIRQLRVNARGYKVSEETKQKEKPGLDLHTTLDIEIQREVEKQLEGYSGACVVIDPRNGGILAMASAPSYDPNTFVPVLRHDIYENYKSHPQKPLLNRACGGTYAPGSTFKPITALAGLTSGFPQKKKYECTGAFHLGGLTLHCSRTWGHGEEDMRTALRDSCNPYFCNLGYTIGTNAVIQTARTFGLGEKTGIDFGVDEPGVVPDAEWKDRYYHEKWFPGDVAQMSIGQGMLLVTPLQMARIAGALGTGYLVRPRIKADVPVVKEKLPFDNWQFKVVRDGMEKVVDGGTGKNARLDTVNIAGKTGTAEVGRGASKRKNTWFIAYAPAEEPRMAIAMIIENGDSGGGTVAPKVRKIFESVYRSDEHAQ